MSRTQFIDQDFLLSTSTSRRLYHDYASMMPVIDYHNHLSPQLIAEDNCFSNITQAWLAGDHYKWRAMRINGTDESYCTGPRSDREKFRKWAETVPYTLRNPLYHWTHLELKRYFGIDELLSPASADTIYDRAGEMLTSPDFSVRNLLRKMRVKVICTTDDPIDSLEYHAAIAKDNCGIRVLPAFRPDKAMQAGDTKSFNEYVGRLEAVTNRSIPDYSGYLEALKLRHDFFASMNCSVSDHGLEYMHADKYTAHEVASIFEMIRNGREASYEQAAKLRSDLLYQFAIWDWEKGWVQQFHLGALRNNNERKFTELGADTGWDSIGDFGQATALAKFLDRLDSTNQLTKTILYNLNPSDNEVFATMAGNFNDGSFPGKIQFGSGWWFLDQKDGMTRQLNALSNMGLLSRFIGMLTDSRSFLSFPRHEYFRRILCDLLGSEVEKGELPDNPEWIGKIVSDICYNNAANYFNWKEESVATALT